MLIDLTDNTRRIKGFQSGQPMAYLRRAGLASLGRDDGRTMYADGLGNRRRGGGIDGLGDFTDVSLPDTDTITKLNAESVFLLNLYRTSTGQQPLQTNLASPTVNVGLSDGAKAAALGIGALVLIGLLAHR